MTLAHRWPARCAGLALLPVLALTLALAPVRGVGQDQATQKPAAAPAAQEFRGDPYLLDTDPISGETLGEVKTQIVLRHEGRELRFAKQANADAFLAEPAKFLAALDAKMAAAQRPLYPLETCLISGEKLGSMGPAVEVVHKNRLLRLCCKACTKHLGGEELALFAKLDQAVIEKQRPGYKVKMCVVTDEPLEGESGEPVELVAGNRLVRLCCKACKKRFNADPLTYLRKLDAAAAK